MAINFGGGFVNPGYAVSNTLQDILTRRKAESRQAMLDEITAQNAASERAMNESLMEERRAQAERYKAIAAKERLNDYAMGQNLSEQDVQWMRDNNFGGLVKESDTNEYVEGNPNEAGDDSGNVLPVHKKAFTYAGSPEEQRKSKAWDMYRQQSAMPDWEQRTPLEKYLVAREIFPNGNVPEWAIFGQDSKDKRSAIYQEYLDYKGEVERGGGKPMSFDAYMTHDANRKASIARAGAAGGTPPTYTWKDEIGNDGQPTGRMVALPNRLGATIDPKAFPVVDTNALLGGQGTRVGPAVGSRPQDVTGTFSTQDVKELNKLRRLSRPSFFGMVGGSEAAKNNYTTGLMSFVSKSKQPRVQEALTMVVNDIEEARNHPPDALKAGLPFKLTPSEEREFDMFIKALLAE